MARPVPQFKARIVPGSYALSRLAADTQVSRLADALQQAAQSEDSPEGVTKPDLAILDCPAGDGILTRMALHAADTVAVPMNFSAIDLTANEITIRLIAAAREERGGKPAFAGIIPNRIPRRDTVARDLAFLVAARLPLLPTIPESAMIRRTGSAEKMERRMVVSGRPRSKAAKQFRALYEVLSGGRDWSREDGLADLAEQLRVPGSSLVSVEDQLMETPLEQVATP